MIHSTGWSAKAVKLVAPLLLLLGCSEQTPAASRPPFAYPSSWNRETIAPKLPGPAANASVESIKLSDAGIDANAMDRSVSPCTDLYKYACGNWEKSFDLPAGYLVYDKHYDALDERTDERVRAIIEEIRPERSDAIDRALRDFYHSCMDESQIESLGAAPLSATFKTIRGATTRGQLAKIAAVIHPAVDLFFHMSPGFDANKPTIERPFISSGGVNGAPNAMLIGTSPDEQALRIEYHAHVVRLLELAKIGHKEATDIADDAMAIEIALAQGVSNPVNRKQELLDVAGLTRQAPGFAWPAFMAELRISDQAKLLVEDSESTKAMARVFEASSVKRLAHYMVWRWLVGRVQFLPSSFRSEEAAWRQRSHQSFWANIPRWKICARQTKDTLRLLITDRYVAKYASNERRQDARALFHSEQSTAQDLIEKLPWLDEKNQVRAEGYVSEIAFAESVFDSNIDLGITMAPDAFFENEEKYRIALFSTRFASAGKPAVVRRWNNDWLVPTIWGDYNAPAVLMSSVWVDDAKPLPARLPLYYGTLGVGVAQGIMGALNFHALRSNGAGEKNGWLVGSPRKHYEAAKECVQNEPADLSHGALVTEAKSTVDAAIRERAAVEVAFRTFRKARHDASQVTNAEGLSEDQQFFVAYAQDRCQKWSDDRLRSTEFPDALPAWERVSGVQRDVPQVAEAFNCQPKPHCEVW